MISISFDKYEPPKTTKTQDGAEENQLVESFANAVLQLHGRKEALILKRTKPLWDWSASFSDQIRKENEKRRVVSFGDVQIREYDIAIGDNPAVTVGAPLGIDWSYVENEPESLDDYERRRGGQRRHGRMGLTLNYFQRHDILEKAGFSKKEIKAAERRALRARKRRKSSIFWYPLVSKLETNLGRRK